MGVLQLTPPIKEALDELRAVRGTFVVGRDAMTVVELAKLKLADVVLAELEVQRRARLPKRVDRGVIYVTLRPVRRKGGV